jgi:hypothetical protein
MQIRFHGDGGVTFSGISAWELGALRAVPVLGDVSGHEGAARRLYPAAVVAADAAPEDEADWGEYVRPELEKRFAAAMDQVAGEVRGREAGIGAGMEEVVPAEIRAPELRAPEIEPPRVAEIAGPRRPRREVPREVERADVRSIRVAGAEIELWYLALNQARLVMSERFDIDSEKPEGIMALIAAGKIETVYYYEFYTSLCGVLVEALRRAAGG